MLFIWALCLEKLSRVTKSIRNVNDCMVGKLIKDTFYTYNRSKKMNVYKTAKLRENLALLTYIWVKSCIKLQDFLWYTKLACCF